MNDFKSPLTTLSLAGIDLKWQVSRGLRGLSRLKPALLILVLLLPARTVKAQTTQFTYQGRLVASGNTADGQYDFQFRLFDTATVGTGTQQGVTQTLRAVQVTSGLFIVQLDFGACASCFNGSPRFLEIAVKSTSDPSFTILS